LPSLREAKRGPTSEPMSGGVPAVTGSGLCMAAGTHPVDATLDHPLFTSRKEGRSIFKLYIIG